MYFHIFAHVANFEYKYCDSNISYPQSNIKASLSYNDKISHAEMC